jgi:hypothetical protein
LSVRQIAPFSRMGALDGSYAPMFFCLYRLNT